MTSARGHNEQFVKEIFYLIFIETPILPRLNYESVNIQLTPWTSLSIKLYLLKNFFRLFLFIYFFGHAVWLACGILVP